MTHDELLAKIDKQLRNFVPMGTKVIPLSVDRFMFALRAVVELHKPDQYGCTHCEDVSGPSCPTIEAIEKELI